MTQLAIVLLALGALNPPQQTSMPWLDPGLIEALCGPASYASPVACLGDPHPVCRGVVSSWGCGPWAVYVCHPPELTHCIKVVCAAPCFAGADVCPFEVTFGRPGCPLFGDGFESGDPSAWSMVVSGRPELPVFGDGFESGDPSAWSMVVSGRASLPAAAVGGLDLNPTNPTNPKGAPK